MYADTARVLVMKNKIIGVSTTLLLIAGSVLGSAAVANAAGEDDNVNPPATSEIVADDTVVAETTAPIEETNSSSRKTSEATIWMHWLTTNTEKPTAATVNWPQTLIDPATCGTGWVQNDEYLYGTDEHKAIVDALDDDGLLVKLENGNPEDHAVVVANSWNFTQQPACPKIVPKTCAAPTVLATSTNLDQKGWVLKEGTAKYVAGGVELTSTAWDGGKVTLATNFPLSEAANMAIDYTQGAGSGSVAILFNTAVGQIHWEPSYTDALWMDEAGVLPRNNPAPGNNNGQGGPYSGSLNDLSSDPIVTSVTVGVWGGESDVVTVHSVSFNCTTQPFDFEKAVVVTDPTPPTGVKAGDEFASPWAAVVLALMVTIGVAVFGRKTLVTNN